MTEFLKQIEDILAIPAEEAIHASGKSGIGVNEILKRLFTAFLLPDGAITPSPEPSFLTINLILLRESSAMSECFQVLSIKVETYF